MIYLVLFLIWIIALVCLAATRKGTMARALAIILAIGLPLLLLGQVIKWRMEWNAIVATTVK